jgi:hypothetical protein
MNDDVQSGKLTQKTSQNQSMLSEETRARLREAFQAFCPEESVSLPLVVRDLRLNEDNFVFRNVRRQYSKVTNLYVDVRRISTALMTNSYVKLKIRTVDNALIGMTVREGVFSNKKYRAALSAASILRNKTYDSRRAYYLGLLKTLGYIEYKFRSSLMRIPTSVRIYREGIVVQGGKRVDLKKARSKGVFFFHTSVQTWTGRYSASNPQEIAMSEKSNPRYVFSLRINALWDYDVIASVINSLSEGNGQG